jgi:hypothetical protein
MTRLLAIACYFLSVGALAATPVAQSDSEQSKTPGYTVERTPLPPGVFPVPTEIPLPIDIDAAEQFVRLAFGPHLAGGRNFQAVNFLTDRLSSDQASQLVQMIPEYRTFKGPAVALAVGRFKGRVSAVEFGREGSPVLYFELPYWTHQREGPVAKGRGSKISDEENSKLVSELREVFVGGLGAEEFSANPVNSRRIRIWWH